MGNSNNKSIENVYNKRVSDNKVVIYPQAHYQKHSSYMSSGNNTSTMVLSGLNTIAKKLDTCGHWKPNDELYRIHSAYTNQLSKTKQYRLDLEVLNSRRETLEKELEKYNSLDVDPFTRVEISNINNQMTDIEIKANGLKNRIDKFNQTSTEVINLWDTYYASIAKLIVEYDLGEFTTVVNLICSQNIHSHFSVIYKELMHTMVKEEVQHKLDRLLRAIDINYVIDFVNNQNKDYISRVNKIDKELFGIDNYVVPTYKLLEEINKEASKIRVVQNGVLLDGSKNEGLVDNSNYGLLENK